MKENEIDKERPKRKRLLMRCNYLSETCEVCAHGKTVSLVVYLRIVKARRSYWMKKYVYERYFDFFMQFDPLQSLSVVSPTCP